MLNRSIGILAEDRATVFNWSSTETMLRKCGAKIIFLVEKPVNRPRRRWRDLPARALWRLVSGAERRAIGWSPDHYLPLDPIELPCEFRGHFKDFPESALRLVSELNFDLIIRLGGRGIYRGGMLTAASGGLISIHHGDNRDFRGGPPGFWEFLAAKAECGYIVQRLTGTLDGGEVLARGFIESSNMATENLKNLYVAADLALSDVISGYLNLGCFRRAESQIAQLGPIYQMPGISDLAAYIWKSWIMRRVGRLEASSSR